MGVITFILFYVAAMGFQFILSAVFLFSRDNRNVLTEHRVELRPEGLYEETAYIHALFLWPAIHRVITGLGVVAIYVTAHSALLIPYKSFASSVQREEFVRTIEANVRAVPRRR